MAVGSRVPALPRVRQPLSQTLSLRVNGVVRPIRVRMKG
jgi:hypothetical protein